MTPEALAALHASAFTMERPWSADEFSTLCAHPHTHLSTIENGFALWRAVAGEAELLTIAVDPAFQRRGLGRTLMHTWMEKAALEAEYAFLEVAADNAPACALYASCGYKITATRRGYYARTNGKVDGIVMQTQLKGTIGNTASEQRPT